MPSGLLATLAAVQALGDASVRAPLWCATRGAVAVGRSESIRDPAQATVWGLGRVVALEHPDRWGGLVDLPARLDEAALGRLPAALAGAGDEDQVAVRTSGIYGRRLVREPGERSRPAEFRPRGTVLITGGTGALGAQVARWLASREAEHLLLVSRRGPQAPGASDLADELTRLGTQVTVTACDVADSGALAAVLAAVPAEFPLSAVIHTAGVVDDGVLATLTPDKLAAVLRPKLTAAVNLHELTQDLDLTAFVLFSSTAGTLGAPGQGSYAAANAFLDALAESRRARDLPATSIAWGPWAGAGMAADEAVASHIRRGGLLPMAPPEALSALARAIEHHDVAVVTADIDWARHAATLAAIRPSPLTRELARESGADQADSGPVTGRDAAPAGTALREHLADLAGPARDRFVLDLVRGLVATVLGHADAGAVGSRQPFSDLGFDSLTVVALRNALVTATGLRLPTTVVFDYPSPQGLAAFLLGELLGSLPDASVTPPADPAAPGAPAIRAVDEDPIAIVGIGCRFPGGVASPLDLWQLVVTGTDAICAFPADRGWDLEALSRGSATLEGGFLDRAGWFDAEFFGISPREALAMDPQQRLLLETSWEALERAGIDPASLRDSKTGVFVGTNGQDYLSVLRQGTSDVRGHAATGTTASVMSGRLSYTLGLEGPAITVDTACSSALVATHMAVRALRGGECSLALASGVSIMTSPDAFAEFTAAGGLAPDGRCKAFADSADGTGWSEGAGVLVLERLSDARRNGHPVWGLIRGSAVNSDGASNGLTAPNGRAQQRVIAAALADAGLSPADVDAVEAHGTGTTLGDPIEAHALIAAYGPDRERPLLLGSVKSNLGHTQAAAGAAGIIKMIMAMRHGEMPATLHVGTPSSHVDWSAGTLSVVTEPQPWPDAGRPRRAGVSSFGISGTNAHVIVEQAPPVSSAARREIAPAELTPWPISGRTPAARQEQAARLLSFAAAPGSPSAADIGFSLATGRTMFAHRAVLLADDDGVTEVARGEVSEAAGQTAVLFSGQGSQRLGMGQELYARFPVFAEAFDAVLARLDIELDRPLREVMWGTEQAALDDTGIAQPALFALEVALFRLSQSWGIRPDAVAGHSIGEITAAHVAGVISLDDACTLVAARARLMQALPAGGVMIAVQASEEELAGLLPDGASIAAVNTPDGVVLAGQAAVVQPIAAQFAAQGRRTRPLRVSHAFHSALMDPMLDDFRRAAQRVSFRPPQLPLVSNVTGGYAPPELVCDAEYWVRHARETVRFAAAIQTLAAAGVTTFLELGPGGALAAMAQQNLDQTPGVTAVALRGERPRELLTVLARLHVAGVGVDWAAWFAGTGAQQAELPTYPFQRELYWPERAVPAGRPAAESWHYRVTWKPVQVRSADQGAGSWLALVPAGSADDGWAAAVVAALGDDVVRVEFPAAGPLFPDGPGLDFRGVAWLAGASQAGRVWPEDVLRALEEAGIQAPLWCVTRGAVSVGRAEPPPDPEQAALWGAGRVAALDHPAAWGGLADLPGELDDRAATRLRAALAGTRLTDSGGEDEIAIRTSAVFGRRLVRAQPHPAAGSLAWRPSGTVLVAGILTQISAHLIRWLAQQGAGHVVLAGPGEPDSGLLEVLRRDLAGTDSELTVMRCELADSEAMATVLDRFPPASVFLAAQQLPSEADPGSILAALAADIAGLRTVLAGRPLEAFVLFASVAGVWGVSGQGASAAAGAYLDAFARGQQAAGTRTLTVSWGAWDAWDGGIPEGFASHLRRSGLPAMDPQRALGTLPGMIAAGEVALTVADVVWDRFGPAFAQQRPTRLFDELPETRGARARPGRGRTAGDAAGLASELAARPEADRLEALRTLVRAEAAAVLEHRDSSAIAPGRPFRDLGFDSLTAVDLRNALGAATGLSLPATLVFDYPTVDAVAALLHAELFGRPGLAEGTAPSAHRPSAGDPIVIVGMSCRYPGGVRSPEELWQLVRDGVDAIGTFPADRGWDLDRLSRGDASGAGRCVTQHGGFLTDAADFDPGFFGISPGEAMIMDPQQRIVLEAAWEALEAAGIDPVTLRGGDTGVFIGGGSGDYRPPAGQLGHAQTAQSASLLSGRVSYAFGFEGPSVSVDTACSSSLVALHMAAQSLRSGECSIALAGGVTVMSTPVGFVEFGEMGALSPEGRCRAFDDAADGTAWSEGVGVLVVERLSDAVRHDHQVLAVLRGSAINSDGASNGLTAPNGPSQERVIRRALADAGLSPGDVEAVEAHGTGTKLGDPIEAQALLATYGRDRERPLLLGAIKSNIGHSQAASGVAGVIKMILAMRHGELPKTLHIERPSSHVDWSAGAVELLTEAVPWPDTGRPRRAGVSSFGASGTNAHVVLEQAPPKKAPPEGAPGGYGGAGSPPGSAVLGGIAPPEATQPKLIMLSGAVPEVIAAQAARLAAYLAAHPAAQLDDLAFSLATTRASLEHRAVVLAVSREDLLAGLDALTSARAASGVVRGRAAPGSRSAFLFPGQGSQRLGMGRELYARFPVFADAMDAAVARFDAELDRPLLEVMWGQDADALDDTGFAQPALFALEVALFRLLESWGLRPGHVIGHSVGEIAAAHVAGVFSLDDACTLVAARARLMRSLPPGGAMVAIAAAEDEVTARLTQNVSIAAVNGPSATVISGDETAVLRVAATFADRKTRRLRVSHAFHSAHMDPVLAEFSRVAASLSYAAPTLPLIANLTGELAPFEELCTPGYWVDHVRQAVRFGAGARTLAERGVTLLLELGPDGTLCAMAQETLDAAVAVPALRRDCGEEEALVTALARLHVNGLSPHWPALFTGTGARRIELPTYAFSHQRFWPQTQPVSAQAEDGEFWAAVQEADFDTLRATLDVDGEALAQVLPALHDWRRRRDEQTTVDSWIQRLAWRPADVGPSGVPSGTWLAAVPPGYAEDPWVTDVLHILPPGAVPLEVSRPDREALAGRLRDSGREFTGVVSLLALAADVEDGLPAGLTLTTTLVQALGDAGIEAPLWCLTRGAVAVAATEPLPGWPQAAVWGFGRVAALEHPRRWGGLIDLPEVFDGRCAARLAGVLADAGGEDQLAVRPAALYARRLGSAPPARPAARWDPDGTVLVTGGTGSLGAHVSRQLAGAGARHLVLVSRSGPDAPGAGELQADLAGLGAQVTIVAGDAADRDAVAAVLAAIPAEVPLTAVIHAAGVLDDGVIDGLTAARFTAVFRSKVTAALVLDELTRELDLRVFALFSSASGAVGNPGQASYAAANAVLDALAEQRRARGLPATSIAWGAWGGAGMAADGRALAAARRTGVRPLDPDLAVLALRRVVMAADPTVVVSDTDTARFIRTFTAIRPSRLLEDLPGYAELARGGDQTASDLRRELATRPARRRLAVVLDLVRARAADVLGHGGPESVGADRAFRDLGFDSLSSVELRNQLSALTGLPLPATLVFDHPNPSALAEHLLRELDPGAADGEDPDADDGEIRKLLACVPVARLRETGVLAQLLTLAGAATASPAEPGESIDEMEVDDLVQAAFNGVSHEVRGNGAHR